ncbi:MAG: sulfatase [Acidobacteriota bacterium]
MIEKLARSVAAILTSMGLALLVVSCSDRVTVEEPVAPSFRNLIVVMIDTLRRDSLGSYGAENDLLPYLSSLAAEGVQLQAYAASSWTRSSVATLLTGLYPQRHQVVGRSDALGIAPPFLPELLRQQGFQTAAVVTNGNVSQLFGFDRGFDRFELELGQGKPDAELTVDRTLEVAVELESPFFLYVHFIDPHTPYVPNSVSGRPDLSRDDYIQPQQLLNGDLEFSDSNVGQLKAQYNAEVSEMDSELERLMLALEAQGLLQDTLVVFTSDHGEEFNEHGGLAHGFTLYEEVLRVPMILWSDSGLEPLRPPAAFPQVDFAPTMLEALGTESPSGIDGRSVWRSIWSGENTISEELLFHLDMDDHRLEALIAPPMKLVRQIDSLDIELYDLDSDPSESSNQSADLAAVGNLESRLGTLQLELGESRYDSEAATLTHNIKQQLEALGYLGGDDP